MKTKEEKISESLKRFFDEVMEHDGSELEKLSYFMVLTEIGRKTNYIPSEIKSYIKGVVDENKDKALASDDVDACLYLARLDNKNIRDYEEVILKHGNVSDHLVFAHINGADVKKLGEFVGEHGSPSDNIEFAQIDGSNVKIHEDNIVYSGSAIDSYFFAEGVPEADIKRLGKKVSNEGSPFLNLSFAQIEGADVASHGKVVAENGDIKDNIAFSGIPGADRNLHKSVIWDKTNFNGKFKFYLNGFKAMVISTTKKGKQKILKK